MSPTTFCQVPTCFEVVEEPIGDVMLCLAHIVKVQRYLTGGVVAGDAVVYYVAWRSRPEVIKIGTTARLPSRLISLGKPGDPAVALVTEPGSYRLEAQRHRQFSHLRVPRTELFRWTPQLQEHVTAVRKVTGWRERCPSE